VTLSKEEFDAIFDPPALPYGKEDIKPTEQCPRCNARLKPTYCPKCHWKRPQK